MTRLGLRPLAVVVTALVAMAAGIAGTDAVILAHRHAAAPAARPAPAPDPSPVLASTHGGAR